ncbi:MAG: hypothetical protein HEP71_33465 [Roseivirga sp.]|nr:hypothetical protein [Roseivirga sp.]
MKNAVLRRWLMACLILTFGLSSLVAQTPQWIRDGIIDASRDTHSITTDAAGNVYVAFSYSAPGILAVAKLDPQGNLIWYDQAGTLADIEDITPQHVHTSTREVRVGGVLIYNDNGTERLFVAFDSQTITLGVQTPSIIEYNMATGAVISGLEYIHTNTAHNITDFKVGDGTLLLLTEDVLLTIDPSDLSISQQWQYGTDPAFPLTTSADILNYQSGGTSPDFFGSQANPNAGEMPFFTGSPLANTKAPTSQDYVVTTPEVPIIYGQTVTYEDENDPNNNEIAEALISETSPAATGESIVMRSVVETSEGLYIYYTYTKTAGGITRQGIMKANKSDNYTIDWGYVWRQDNGNHGTILADQNNNIYLYSWDALFYQRSSNIDMLANKFDKNGNLLWAKTYGSKAEGEGDLNEVVWHSGAIKIDQTNQEIVLALYTDTFNQNTPSGLLLTTNYDGIVQNYTIHSVPGEARVPKGVALDGSGNAYVVYDDNNGGGGAGVFKASTATVFLAPKMSSAAKNSDTQITVTFDENVKTNGGNPTDFTVTDGTGATFAVSAQADGTAGDTDIVLTVANLSTAVGDLTITYTNNNNEISDTDTGVDQDFVATDATGVTIDLDNTAPTVVSAAKDSDTQITVTMSEAVQTTGTNPTDFTVTDANSTPFVVSAQADGTAKDAQIVLTVANLSTAVGDLTVTYTNNNSVITDFGSNDLTTGSATIPDGISLMISEFIANPFGTENISEWVELHNYGSVGIDINGFKLKDEDSDNDVIVSASTVIPAGGYLILTNNKSNFESIWFGGNTVSQVIQMSGITLSNTTDELILTDASNNEIWSLAYSDDETEGKATWISTATNSPKEWGSKASPGVVRDGADNVSGSPTGYQKNNATADPMAFTNTDGDMGSPLNGTVLFASATVDSNVSCNAGADGSLTASALGGVSPYTYIWSNGATSANTTSLPAATFTITVTDANGLTATSQSTITEPAVLGAGSAVDNHVSTMGGNDGGATASATGGTAPYTYSWNNGVTIASITGQVAGTYTVSVTDANGCGPATSQVTITEPTNADPTFTSQPITTIFDNEIYTYPVTTSDSDGDAVGITGTTLPAWLSLTQSPAVVSTFAGDGSFGSPTGTTSTSTFASPSSLVFDSSGNLYVGSESRVRVIAPDGTISNLTINSGQGTAEYMVAPADMIFDGAGNLYIVNDSGNSIEKITPAGDHSVLAGGGSGTADGTGTSATFDNPSGLAMDASGNIYVTDERNGLIRKITSAGVVTTFAGTGGEFSFPAGIEIDDAGNLYVVDTGNSNIKKITPAGVVTLFAGSSSSGTGTADGTGSGARFTYPKYIDLGPDDLFYISDESAQRIRTMTSDGVVATLAGNGSEATVDGTGTSASFNYPRSIEVDASGNVFVGEQTGNYIRRISAVRTVLTGDPSENIGPHSVVLTATDGNSGTAAQSFTITVSAALSVSASVDANVSCNGGSDGAATANPAGGSTPYSYLWSTGDTNAGITGLAAGTYTVTVTDNDGTTATSSSSITEPVALGALSIPDAFVTINGLSNGAASATGTGGTTPYTYLWSTGATNASITNLPAGTYTVTVTDANGCGPATSQVEITQPAVLEAQTVVDFNVDCNGDTGGGASASASGGVQPYTYLWSTGATTSSIGKLENDNSLSAGTYTVTVSDNNGATATSSSTVTEPTALSASVAGSTIDDGFGTIFDETISCNGFTDGGLTASPTGGTGPYTYAWSIGATNASIVGIGAGTYTVTVTDNNGCTTTAQGEVTEPDVLAANANTDMNVSRFNDADGEISSTPTGGTSPYTYLWSNGGTNAAQTALAAGTYTVTVTDANGCTASQSTSVTQPPNSDPEFDSEPVTMVGDDEFYFYLVETSDDDDHDVGLTGTTLPSWLSLENGVFAAINFAGSPGEQGIADGTGSEARFAAPYGIEIDDGGNIYVADGVGLIKKITPDGVVATFAGNGSQETVDGTGSGASFYGPAGLAFDDQGNLYVSEIGGHVIRKITPEAVVSTFVGSGSAGMQDGTGSGASFNQPYGMTSDENGNLYVTDFNNHLIRKVSPAGVVTTFAGSGFGAGTGSGSGSGEGGFGGGTFADGTGTEASFNGPLGIDIDHNGNLYVADAFNAMIRKITPEGVVSQFIGKGIDFSAGEPSPDSGIGPVAMGTGTDAVFAGIPVGLTVDDQDNLYITQGFFGAPAVLKADLNGLLETVLGGGEGGTADGTGTDAEFTSAFDLTIDDFGNIYLAELEASRIRKVVFGSVLIGDPTDQVGDHPVVLDASDGNSGTAQQSFTITVTDETAPEFESGTATSFAENGTGTAYTAQATDTNSKATVTYHLGQGMDSQFFTIDPTTGILTFLNPPDFENPQDGETDNTYKVEIHASDDAQNSSDALVVTITVTDVQEDITAPDKPVITGISDDTGSSATDGITSDRNLLIHGTAEALATVEVFSPGGKIGTTQADANGDWTLDITAFTLPEMMSNTTAEAIDAAQNRSATSDIFVITIDFTAPAKPVVTGISDDTGSSNSDGVTSDRNLLIHGTAEADAIVDVFSPGGKIGTTQADANGDWTLDISAFNLTEINSNTTAEAVDLAGNRSATSDGFVINIDFTAPAKPVITGISDDTGSNSSDGITSDRNLLIHGTAEANVEVEIFSPGGSIGVVPVDANGDWTLDISRFNLPEFIADMTAEAIDLAGNRSAASDPFTLTIDFTAPSKPVITGISDDTGSSNSDGITSDRNLLIHGTAEANVEVEIFSPGGSIGVVPADANGDWTLDISRFNLPEFTANMTAEAIDLAGNRSAASDMFTLTIDFTAPSKPVITGISDDTGISSSDGITSDRNLLIHGTAEANAHVEVFSPGGSIGVVPADANGDWTLDISRFNLPEFTANMTAEAIDLAGNRSVASDMFTLTIDFTSPSP